MPETAEILRERLAAALEKNKTTARKTSLAIGANHSYVSQILNGRGGMPTAAKLSRLAQVLEVSVDYLTGASTNAEPVRSEVAVLERPENWRGQGEGGGPGPRIPLVGTGDCADLAFETESGELVDIERSSFDPEHTVRMITRPPALSGSISLYAIYYQGESMVPRFEPGEIGICDPSRPPRPGDYVLVQLNNGESDEVTSVLAKRLVSANSKEIWLEQFNPPATFKVPRQRVTRLHRILPQTDMLLG